MRKVLLFLAVLSCISFTDPQQLEMESSTKYEQGWEDGFCEGWKYVKGQWAVCPVTPIVPIPKIDCPEGYKCGYNRGFVYGKCKANYGDCKK